jgi:hypothetical protein
MRIGELLVEQRKLSPADLEQALEVQPGHGRRLISLLIATGQLDFDTGSRALGEQRGFPALLMKHLAARDPMLAKLIPAELGRAWGALPIGRATNGNLIIGARDPSPQLKTRLAEATRSNVTLVIAPAARIDLLLAEEYGSAVDEFDVDLGSDVELPPVPPMPDMSALDPESVRLALTGLDDVRVKKDITPVPQFFMQSRTPTLPPTKPTLFAAAQAIEAAATRDAATDAAMTFIAGSWVSALVLAIRGQVAIGYRGHGAAIGKVDAIAIPLDIPSTLNSAIETKRSSIRLFDSSAQRELAKRLGSPSLAAAPIVVADQVVAAIVVGQPIQGLGDTERWIGELSRLARLLGEAYDRIRGSRR